MNSLHQRSLAILAVLAVCAWSAVALATPRLLLQLENNETLEVPLDATQPFSILSSGDLAAKADSAFSCNIGGQCPTCEDVQVSMAAADGGAFSVSPTSVTQGGSVSFSWNARGAWTCSGSQLPGSSWDSFTGSSNGSPVSATTADVVPGVYTPQITCCNGPNCATREVSLEVREPGGIVAGCETRPPPAQLSRATQCIWGSTTPLTSIDCSSWASFFGAAFPTSTPTRQFYQDSGQYLALEFNTGNYSGGRTGRLNLSEPQHGFPSTFQAGEVITSISRCPGDFDGASIIAETDAACYKKGMTLWRSTDYSGGSLPPSLFCPLEPNTTYFYNIVFTNSPAGTAPNSLNWICTGGGSRCGWLMAVSES